MAFKFETLQVWNKSLDLSLLVQEIVISFPHYEIYNLSNQIRRAADSVVLNIAEGSTGQSNAEFTRFLRYALRSAVEVVACLFIAKKKAYIDTIIFDKAYTEYEILCKMITKFEKSLK